MRQFSHKTLSDRSYSVNIVDTDFHVDSVLLTGLALLASDCGSESHGTNRKEETRRLISILPFAHVQDVITQRHPVGSSIVEQWQ